MQSKSQVKKRRGSSSKNEDVPKDKDKRYEGVPKDSSIKIDYKRIVIRCVIIVGILMVVNFMQHKEMKTFAGRKDEISEKSELQECSKRYSNQIDKFPGCSSKQCGRVVTDTLISLSEIQGLSNIAERGFSIGGPPADYATFSFFTGDLHNGKASYNIYSVDKTRSVITKEDFKFFTSVENKIKKFVEEFFGVKNLYSTHPTLVSRYTSLFSATKSSLDVLHKPHVDLELHKSSHYTSVLSLTEYNHHFQGGRLVFVDKYLNQTIESKAGRLSVFTTGSENTKFLEPVTKGTKLEVIFSFTCNPKHDIKNSASKM